MHRRLLAALLLAFALVVTACGDDGDTETDSGDDTGAEDAGSDEEANDESTDPADAEDAAQDTAEDLADDITEDLQETQDAVGGGSATLTVGDEEWTFDAVLCGFGEEEIGQEGAELVVSALQDGTQFYVSVDTFGHRVSLDDIEDFENPSVGLASVGEDFVVIDGKEISGEAEFQDSTSDDFSTTPGSFSATCP